MTSNLSSTKSILALAFCALLASSNALAASAQKAEDKHEDHREHHEGHNKKSSKHFDDKRRDVVRNYYRGKQGRADCPPGLAKKGNGCLPPGQAKKWQLGYALQADTHYQPIPQDLLNLLGTPPAGEHYGMIDDDILLIANLTELVLEVIAGNGQ